jgi:hypothetical protein
MSQPVITKNQQYYLDNREKILARSKKRQQIEYQDPEKRFLIREKQRQYYLDHREDLIEKVAERRRNLKESRAV